MPTDEASGSPARQYSKLLEIQWNSAWNVSVFVRHTDIEETNGRRAVEREVAAAALQFRDGSACSLTQT